MRELTRVTFVFNHFIHAIQCILVRHSTIREWSHCVQSCCNCVKWHTHCYGNSTTCSRTKNSREHNWTKEVVGIFLHPVKKSSCENHHTTNLESISYGASEKSSFFSNFDQAISKALIISSALFWVQLVNLHSFEHNFKWI